MPSITVEHINKSFKKKQILKDVSFKITNHQIIALIGENGAGKTTLINVILNLISTDSGNVTKFDRQEIGVMMQNDISLSRIKVQELIKLVQSYYDHPLPYPELLKISNLSEYQKSYVRSLSGGQRRRLSFALAMAGNPNLLFLDEPTAGMDTRSRQDFWNEIIKLKQSGKTIFVTSHYLNEIENTADRIIFLKDAHIKFDGSLNQLQQLVGVSKIEFDSQLSKVLFQKISGILNLAQRDQHFTIDTKNVNEVMEQLTPLLNSITNLRIQQNTLDSLFTNLQNEGEKNA